MANRVTWPGGWADLTGELTHGRRMRIVRVLPKMEQGVLSDILDVQDELAAAHITAWSVGAVDEPGPAAAELALLPASAVDILHEAAMKVWTGRADPNATTPASDAGPSESA